MSTPLQLDAHLFNRLFGWRFILAIGVAMVLLVGLPSIFNQSQLRNYQETQFVGWNSYINIVNIVEVSNAGDDDLDIKVKLHQSDGLVSEEIVYSLAPGEQRDVILNDLMSFKKDSYGIVAIESNGKGVTGRLSYYRPKTGTSGFEFVFSAPLEKGTNDITTVSFNTFDPSNHGSLIANWLSIVNLSPSAQEFTIEKRNANGDLLKAPEVVQINSFGRFDYEAGHIIPGPNNAGIVRIIPKTGKADLLKYTANLIRYGTARDGIGFDFAFQLQSNTGLLDKSYAPIKKMISNSGDKVQTWVEVVNTSAYESEVITTFHDQLGNILLRTAEVYPPYSQRHYNASEILKSSIFGMVEIESRRSKLAAQSMFYILAGDGMSIADVYGSQLIPSPKNNGSSLLSWNRFLSMENYLTLINTSSDLVDTKLLIFNDEKVTEHSLNIPAHGTKVIRLDESDMGTKPNSYGTVSFADSRLIGELLRLGREDATRLRKLAKHGVSFVNNTIDSNNLISKETKDSGNDEDSTDIGDSAPPAPQPDYCSAPPAPQPDDCSAPPPPQPDYCSAPPAPQPDHSSAPLAPASNYPIPNDSFPTKDPEEIATDGYFSTQPPYLPSYSPTDSPYFFPGYTPYYLPSFPPSASPSTRPTDFPFIPPSTSPPECRA